MYIAIASSFPTMHNLSTMDNFKTSLLASQKCTDIQVEHFFHHMISS